MYKKLLSKRSDKEKDLTSEELNAYFRYEDGYLYKRSNCMRVGALNPASNRYLVMYKGKTYYKARIIY